jgi:hypothetical protein
LDDSREQNGNSTPSPLFTATMADAEVEAMARPMTAKLPIDSARLLAKVASASGECSHTPTGPGRPQTLRDDIGTSNNKACGCIHARNPILVRRRLSYGRHLSCLYLTATQELLYPGREYASGEFFTNHYTGQQTRLCLRFWHTSAMFNTQEAYQFHATRLTDPGIRSPTHMAEHGQEKSVGTRRASNLAVWHWV